MKPKKNPKPPSINYKDLPRAVRIFVDAAPEEFKMAVLLTVLCCYCALATRLRFKYPFDIELHALLVQVLIVGEPGAGKSFTRSIVNRIMGPLKLRDKEMRNKEKAYRKLARQLKNKNLPPEPLIDVRTMQTITKAMLIERVDQIQSKFGETLTLFLYAEEMALLAEANRKSYSDLRTLDRLAYDLNSTYINEAKWEGACNNEVDICYCSLFCGTDNALKEYIDKRSIEGGNVTRKIVCQLPDMLGNKAPDFKPISEEDAAYIDLTVKKLMDDTYTEDDKLQPIHIVPMEWMAREVDKWCDQHRLEVLRTGSRAHNCFYKRSSLTANRLATLLYYLWDEDESRQKSVLNFYKAMASYTVDGLLDQWGMQFDEMHQNDVEGQEKKTSIYDVCPQRFTRDQLRELILKLKLKTTARHFISRWKKAKLIHDVKDSPTELFEKNY